MVLTSQASRGQHQKSRRNGSELEVHRDRLYLEPRHERQTKQTDESDTTRLNIEEPARKQNKPKAAFTRGVYISFLQNES